MEMPRLLFSPTPGSDIIELVRKPEAWAKARQYVKAIQLGVMEHLQTSRPNENINGPTCYPALVEAGWFQKMTEWGIPISLGAPAVKPWSCDGVESLRQTLEALDRVRAAGGRPAVVQIDEPLQSLAKPGRVGTCNLTLEQCADYTSRVIDGIRAHDPNVLVGLYVAYPNEAPVEIIRFYELVQQRGSSPSFMTIDCDRFGIRDQQIKDKRVTNDLAALRYHCAAWKIPCGLAIFGQRAKTEAEYVASAWMWFERQRGTGWDYITVESWEEAPDKTRTMPMNLPETDPTKHAALLARVGEAWLG